MIVPTRPQNITPTTTSLAKGESPCETFMESPTVPKAEVISNMAGTSLKPSVIIIASVARITSNAEAESTASAFWRRGLGTRRPKALTHEREYDEHQ